jgi:hypothetical protein
MQKITIIFIYAVVLVGCYSMRSSRGGGEDVSAKARKINPADIELAPGYKVELVASGLTFPSGIAFDNKGRSYVIETGYSYGEVWGEPKLLRIDEAGKTTVIATGTKNGPWTGITFHDDAFYVSEGGEAEGGKILKIAMDGAITPLVENLPSIGDHHTNCPVVKDGYVYFGQGTATNAAVVGEDNAQFGWLTRHKDFHDIPCRDIILNGVNYESANILTDDPNDKAVTGAYSSFNTATAPEQVIKGSIPCNGAVMRVPVTGGRAELVAWGLRNPFGLSFSKDGKLYATENAFDERGSRSVWGSGDVLWEIKEGIWYGWPDFSAGKPIKNTEEFSSPGKKDVKALLKEYPNTPPKPVAIFGVHTSSNGIDFSMNPSFGYEGEAFVAQFGDMAAKVGKVLSPVGFKVVRVNVTTGTVMDFAVNKGKRNGPASWLEKGGLERPVSVKFDPSGKALYVVDFGIMNMTEKGPEPQLKTGTIWKITKASL